jgi:hypothetical protein
VIETDESIEKKKKKKKSKREKEIGSSFENIYRNNI